ncbi:MAG: glycosyltransferase [Thermoplasmata archaeon]|nr:MAG: glycosyltransferase [Thermoplasmata archaeon]
MNNEIKKYESLMGKGEINEIISLAKELGPVKIQNINSTKQGGGVAELLISTIPLFQNLGFDVSWDVISGNHSFFEITKKFHNILHGIHIPINPQIRKKYEKNVKANYEIISDDADFIIIHDPQPLPLIMKRKDNGTKWIWRCHIDVTEGDKRLIGYLRQFIDRYDCSVYHLPNYTFSSFHDEYIIQPAIDAFTDKNRDLSDKEINKELDRYEIDPEIPIVLQVSRFDKLKNPLGVIKAFQKVRDVGVSAQLILAGGEADDDPEGDKVLERVEKKAQKNPDIHILKSPPDIAVNALQRSASVIVQRSIREGFGLVVTEAMFKGKAVVGSNVGGIRKQIIHGESGFLVETDEGTAYRIQQLLTNPELNEKLGEEARKTVIKNFLMPNLVKNWILLFLSLKHDGRKGAVRLGMSE